VSDKEDRVCIGVVILIDDITEAKVIARSKDEFFSIASHELRTPLTAIRGNASMMLDYYKDAFKDPDLKQMMLDINDASVRLIGIVNDFLDMSSLEMSKIEFKLEKMDMAGVIKEVLKEYEVAGTNNKISLELVEPVSKIAQVVADRNRIKQVLINLVGNGLKFTKDGGIKIELSEIDGFVETRVIDGYTDC
jgi:signal transduction histidine kinase